MRKMILGLTALALAGAVLVPAARAGDCAWATAGKVLTGVFAASVIAHAFDHPTYCAPAPAYACPAPVVYSYPSAPVVYVQPRPVVVRPPVVVPAPVIVRPRVILPPPPVVVAPPVFGLSFGFGGHGHHHHGHR